MGNTLNNVFIKSLIHKAHGSTAILAPSNKFGDHRVVVHRDLGALLYTSVNTNVLMSFGLSVFLEETD